MKVKVRTVGHSNTLTIPKEINVVAGTEYNVEQHADGTIIYTPQHRNPFQGNWFKEDLKQTEMTDEMEGLDSEWS